MRKGRVPFLSKMVGLDLRAGTPPVKLCWVPPPPRPPAPGHDLTWLTPTRLSNSRHWHILLVTFCDICFFFFFSFLLCYCNSCKVYLYLCKTKKFWKSEILKFCGSYSPEEPVPSELSFEACLSSLNSRQMHGERSQTPNFFVWYWTT